MPTMTFKEAEKMIKSDGWYLVRVQGSHHHYRHPTKPGLVTIPKHGNSDINPRVINSIKKQAGLK